ncbi:MAG: hypothetical protein ACYTFG_02355 [Planctomycetota bacterium]|jgi:hypothetical protein
MTTRIKNRGTAGQVLPSLPWLPLPLKMILISAFALFLLGGCGRRETFQAVRQEREALARTVGRIHAAHLSMLTRQVPPQRFSPREVEVFERGSSILDLHEMSEMTLEKLEEDIQQLEEEIYEKEEEIRKSRETPHPYPDLKTAMNRQGELYLESKRVEYLRWRRQ